MAAEDRIPDPPSGADPLFGVLVGGRYRVLGTIGEGGMGKVYEALHEGLGRPVAIKVLGAAWASDEQAIQRFQREARTASNIGHRAIVDVSDLGRLDDGRPFLVMERLRGESFADLVERHGRLPADRVARLTLEVASALDAVHARGIVHRDIKPENLIVLDGDKDDAAEYVKLLDFGLAAFAIPSADAARLTRHGQMHGTPHYMAPESGEETLPDYRADVYALATVAYELLTGFVPFDSKNPLQILTRKMHEEPPLMRDRAGVELGDAVENVLQKGLARLPDERYASAGEFAHDLAMAVSHLPEQALAVSGTHRRVPERGVEFETAEHEKPVPLTTRSSAPPPPVSEMVPLHRRPPVLWGAGAAALALLLLGVGVAALGGEDEPSPSAGEAPALAPAPKVEAPPPASEAKDRAAEAKAAEAAAQAKAEAKAAEAAEADETEAAKAAEAAKASADEAEHGAAAATRRARRAHRQARLRERKAAAEKEAQASAQKKGPEEPAPRLAETDRAKSRDLSRQGTSSLIQGRLPEAIRLFRDATLAFSGNATAWRGLGLANERLGRKPEAIRAYQRYLRLAPNASDAASVQQRLSALQGH